jgi:cell division protein FtsQ
VRRPRLLRRLLLGASVLGGVAAGLAAAPSLRELVRELLRSERIQTRRIAVEGAQRLSAREVADATGVSAGTPLAELDVEGVLARLRAHPWIAQARAVRLPPDRLIVRVHEREPRGVTAAAESETPLLVDADGVPFAPATQRDLEALPRLAAPAPTAPGERSAALAGGIALAAAIERAGLGPVREISASAARDPVGFVFRLGRPEARVVIGHEDWETRLARLARLLAAGLPEADGAQEIDLRFAERAVLRGVGAPEGAPETAGEREGAGPPEPGQTG